MKEREIYGVKVFVSGEDYDDYKGTLEEQLEEKDKEIERLNNIIAKNKYSADELCYIKELEERIDRAIHMIEDLMANNLEVHKGEPIIKVLKGEDKE